MGERKSFRSMRTLEELTQAPIARPNRGRQQLLGYCGLNVTTRIQVGDVVAAPKLVAIALDGFLEKSRDDVLGQDLVNIEGVKQADVKKVIAALTPEMLKEVFAVAGERAMIEDEVKLLTGIPLVVEKYANLHGCTTEIFYRAYADKVEGVKADKAAHAKSLQAQQLVADPQTAGQAENDGNQF